MRNILELIPRVVGMGEYLGFNLKMMREKKRLNQLELAKSLGVDQPTISKWENDKIRPPVSFYEPLTKALDLPEGFFDRPWEKPFATYNYEDIIGEWKTIKDRLEGLEAKVGVDYSKPLPATPVTRFASLLNDADMVTLYACLYLLSGSKADLEKVHSVIRNEVVELRHRIRPLRSARE
jgi:transcriptional regulator with XRE-family HTH domain